jgi:DNA gyrase subunit A
MRFREDDELLTMSVVKEGTFVFTATDRGFGKRTAVERYPVRGRGGLGVIAAKTVDERGELVGALIVEENDEVLAITANGGVIRTKVSGLREAGRDTMGVQLIHVGRKDAVIAIARNAESENGDDADDDAEAEPAENGSADVNSHDGSAEDSERPISAGGTVSATEPTPPADA